VLVLSYSAAAQEAGAESESREPKKDSFSSRFKDPVDGWFDASGWLLENIIGFMPIPLIITEPAIDNGLGLAGRVLS